MPKQQKQILLAILLPVITVTTFILWSVFLDPHSSGYDAEYVGAKICSECHTRIYPEWQRSPHANMTRDPSPVSVVGNFDGGNWMLPPEARRPLADEEQKRKERKGKKTPTAFPSQTDSYTAVITNNHSNYLPVWQ